MDPGEEDDDFGDFGGFEAADPMLPNVAQVQPTGIEASPSPWAVFAAGTSPGNVKPDLLCGQNRFPPVLDPSVPSSSADGDVNNSHYNGSYPTGDSDGTSGNQHDGPMNFDDAVLANEILDGSFKSTSSHHSSSAATGADIIRDTNSDLGSGSRGTRKDSHSVDLVGDLLGASPGILLIEDENMKNDSVDIGEGNSTLIKNRKSSNELFSHFSAESSSQNKMSDFDRSVPQRVPASPGGSSHSSESHHMNSPILIDSLRKALQQKPTSQVVTQVIRKAENSPKIEPKTAIDPVICEEIKQARIESQVAIATVIEQYKELSKQCIAQQEDVLKECKQIMKQDQEVQLQQLLRQQKEDFSKVLEEEKARLQKESQEQILELISEQKKTFDSQMETERKMYEQRLQEALGEEKERCRKNFEESLEAERLQMTKRLEAEKEKFRTDLEEDRKKYLEEMKTALIQEKEKNRELVKELLEQEKNHCRECVTASMESVKKEMDSYIEQQKQKEKVIKHRELSSLNVFLETAKQQLNVLIEDNQNDLKGTKLCEEKNDVP